MGGKKAGCKAGDDGGTEGVGEESDRSSAGDPAPAYHAHCFLTYKIQLHVFKFYTIH